LRALISGFLDREVGASNEYSRLIVELDRVLAQIRGLWIEARAPADRLLWRVRLDNLLDERLRLMRLRDIISNPKENAA
jgi:hypothetical protein